MTESGRLLLDTCMLLFAASGEEVRQEARDAVDAASAAGLLYVSPVSAWEIGLLMSRGRLKSSLSAIDFFDRFIERAACKLSGITPAIFANASFLPNLLHRDPADCLLIATARALDFTLVTRDKIILEYGAEGYVKTYAC